MFRLATLFVLVFILTVGGFASGQCTADGNDSEADASPIGFIQTVSDWVCPDDVFDYYTLDITQGASVTGTITFESPQRSTVLRVWHADSGMRLINDIFTNDTVHQLTVPVSMNNAPGGTYYARVFYWSEAAFDHEYTLTLDLQVGGISDCQPDGNDTIATAGEIAFGSSVSDWVCPDDTLDIWHFTIADPDTEGFGTADLTSGDGDLVLQMYDTNDQMMAEYPMINGSLEITFGFQGTPYPAGDYHFCVALPSDTIAEISYTLSLAAFQPPYLLEIGPSLIKAEALLIKTPPWPSLRADTRNTNRSTFGGPGSDAILNAAHFLLNDLDLNDDPGVHVFEDLLLGPDNRAYFEDRGTNTLYAYDLIDGYQWEFPLVNTEKPSFCLDRFGNIYAIARNGVYLHKLDRDGNELWNKRIYGADGQSMALWPVGYRICMSETLSGKVYFYIWEQDGTEVLTREELYRSRIPGVIQSKQADIFIRTISSTYKFNANGIEQWADHYIWPSREGLIAMGEDGRVWVYMQMGRRYKVYNPSGTLYADEHYPYPGAPIDACVGGDGRFYVITDDGQLVCYTNWDQEVWRIDNPGDGNIMRIIMDKNGFIYILYYIQTGNNYSYSWATVDPDDGDILFEQFIVQPGNDDNDPWGHIAIGENGYLVYLNGSGYLGVYKPVLSLGTFDLKFDIVKERFEGE